MNYYLDHIFDDVDPDIHLDEEQKEAILCDEDNVMIVAGAGAGKTTTMAAKIKYLVEVKKIPVETILMISYTNKAVNELEQRIQRDFGIEVPIYTFHKLGMGFIKKYGKKKQILAETKAFLETIIWKEIRKNEMLKFKILKYFSYYEESAFLFNQNSKIKNLIKKFEYISLLGRIKKENNFRIKELEEEGWDMSGEVMQRVEEAMVANFFFLNSISYEYHPSYPYDNYYIPDFCIRANGICYYIELDYDEIKHPVDVIRKQFHFRKIRKLHEKNNTNLLELSVNSNFLETLKNLCIENQIPLKKKSKREVFEILSDLKESLLMKDFYKITAAFVHNFKLNGFKESCFLDFKQKATDERTLLFLEIVEQIYLSYQKELKERNLCDFEDMIQEAILLLDSKDISLPYRYIIVDEYQDTSMERFLLLKKIIEHTNAKLIVVGDDFQSIFSFAGSDISLFMNFKNYIGPYKLMKITNTYRNSQELINMAGTFVMKNSYQIKKELRSSKSLKNPIRIYFYDEKRKAYALNYILEKLVKEYGDDLEVLLLGRYQFDLYSVLHKNYFIRDNENISSVLFPKIKLTFLTIHASKGLGFSHVILLNAEEGKYGFPSYKENDPVMNFVIYRDESYEFAEERRLFYVALTRTKNTVSILSPLENPSPFLEELSNAEHISLSKKRWKKKNRVCPKCHYPLVRNYWNKKHIDPLYQCVNDTKVCGFETNNLFYKKQMKPCARCKKGYIIVKKYKGKDYLQCTECNYRKPI